MIIIGIDPGYERCGFAVLQQVGNQSKLLTFGTIRTKAQTDFLARQTEIAEDFTALMTRYKPDKLAIKTCFLRKM